MDKYLKETYVKLTPKEHILKRPGMYIGSLISKLNNLFIFDSDKNKIINKEILFNEGLYKIIDEIITNAIDQTIKDSSLSVIYSKITEESFSLFNNGEGIDVAIHPEHKIYIPQLIFSELLSSTNYNDEISQVVGGTYGIGIKLSVIFSKKFELKVWDAKRKLYFYQIYENNLSKISKPVVKKYKDIKDEELDIKEKYLKTGGVKIKIYPDFERFGVTKFNEDFISLIKRRLLDLIVVSRKNIDLFINDFNNKIDKNNGIESYLNLYDLSSNDEWHIGHCVKNHDWQYAIRFYKNSSNINLTFVNGIYTNRDGTHVNYFIDLIFEKLKKIVGSQLTKKILLDNVIIFLKTTIINPTFSSQSKEELTTSIKNFGYECEIPDSFYNSLKDTVLIEELKNIIIQSNQKILSKFDGSKKSKIKFIPKLEDANFAGTKKSLECTLILTEGDSAKSTALAGLSEKDRNYYGIYPLRGKLLNVRDASIKQINNNQEILDITKIIGLKLKTVYTKDNLYELRYGSILLMTDADLDGSHIKGLVMNYLDFFYPSLLLIPNFLKVLVTPLIKATYKQQLLTFPNTIEFDKWKTNIKDLNVWKIKYYKGLGTSTSKEAVEYFKNIDSNLIFLNNTKDEDKSDGLLLAFSKDKIEARKKWLVKYDPTVFIDITINKNVSINDFINYELIHFSNYDNIRSIGSIVDGLKPSQRKIMYTCLKKNIINEIKVSILASIVSETSAYHHGENSLILTIINMCHDFVSSNNLNLLKPIGQFGSRLMNGKDHASARYIYTHLEDYTNKIFIKEDNDLLNYLEDDGLIIEPNTFIPIIPLILINGCEGIGTGFSTFIPCHNTVEIIDWLLNKLLQKKNKLIIPFYKGFKGKIFKYDDTTFISEGSIEFHKNELHITEIPIRVSIIEYKSFLEELLYEKKNTLFKSYFNMCSDTSIKFILKFNQEYENEIKKMYNTVDSLPEMKMNNLYKYLSLYKTIKISNMYAYSFDNVIKKYNSAEDILNEFYKYRLLFFNERKNLILNKINENIKFISNQINFIKLVIKDKGKIYKVKDIEIYLEKNKFNKINNSFNYLTNLTFNQLTQNNLNKLENKLFDYKNEYTKLFNKTDKELWITDLNNLKIMLSNSSII
jgi:DNA topoisomerase-2